VVSATLLAPGIAVSLSTSRSMKRTRSSGLEYLASGSDNRPVRIFSAGTPTFWPWCTRKLLIINPAPASSTTESVNWNTTSPPESHPARRPIDDREPSFSVSFRSTREARIAGARPNRSPAAMLRICQEITRTS
jgi:hypothetical protein